MLKLVNPPPNVSLSWIILSSPLGLTSVFDWAMIPRSYLKRYMSVRAPAASECLTLTRSVSRDAGCSSGPDLFWFSLSLRRCHASGIWPWEEDESSQLLVSADATESVPGPMHRISIDIHGPHDPRTPCPESEPESEPEPEPESVWTYTPQSTNHSFHWHKVELGDCHKVFINWTKAAH